MATYACIHGAGDSAWYWNLLAAELRRRGQDVVAPDLPIDDDSAGLPEYAATPTRSTAATASPSAAPRSSPTGSKPADLSCTRRWNPGGPGQGLAGTCQRTWS